ncbi:glycosyltransferase [Hymenobacter arizonensis]|uniref:Methyltransferase domain-containing protein n=1 Tax=Hymenobacter arizonensis TaxID=1227077 RepID=A0A1I6BRR6_HYMAR|nr:glycosyltransferase [Hymenobacter arizonensis]SFQ83638.1 Methyltransferase domain-containing protein [Hymenobacter arizonensis]
MNAPDLVSLIIPCYNQGHLLTTAIESVLNQTYSTVEILVIDDGSVDNTRAIAAQYSQVQYIYQPNQGLSAARNTGILRSQGQYLIFLDADDWLYPKAIAVNINYLKLYPASAFVAGSYDLVYSDEQRVVAKIPPLYPNTYSALLAEGNFIGMIAAVMFPRWVLDEFPFAVELRRCEDYDLYLRITRKYQIVQHQERLAAYRMHPASLSANAHAMLSSALQVLLSQQAALQTTEEMEALTKGIYQFKEYYYTVISHSMLTSKTTPSRAILLDLLQYSPYMFARYYLLRKAAPLSALIKRGTPKRAFQVLRKLGLINHSSPSSGKVDFGDLARLAPLCDEFGYTRGGPIDRYYIENFLRSEALGIKNRVLEIGDNSYTLQFGNPNNLISEVLHINEGHPQATYVGDLSNAPHLPDDTFDCIVLTQTLQFIYDFTGALRTCYRILKPGGMLLLTCPGLTPIDKGEWQETWYWSFTDKALRKIMAEIFNQGQVEVKSFGNVFVATAFLYGLGLPEVTKEQLDYFDPQFQVINTVKAVKPLPSAEKLT